MREIRPASRSAAARRRIMGEYMLAHPRAAASFVCERFDCHRHTAVRARAEVGLPPWRRPVGSASRKKPTRIGLCAYAPCGEKFEQQAHRTHIYCSLDCGDANRAERARRARKAEGATGPTMPPVYTDHQDFPHEDYRPLRPSDFRRLR